MGGASPIDHEWPPSFVAASTAQSPAGHGAQPSVHPSSGDTNVTDIGWKPVGTGAAAATAVVGGVGTTLVAGAGLGRLVGVGLIEGAGWLWPIGGTRTGWPFCDSTIPTTMAATAATRAPPPRTGVHRRLRRPVIGTGPVGGRRMYSAVCRSTLNGSP